METLQQIFVTILLAVWLCLSIGLVAFMAQNLINDHRREKREKEKAAQDLEYHTLWMKELKK